MYYEIDMSTAVGRVHCIVEGPEYDPNGTSFEYNMIKIFENGREWCNPVAVTSDWIVKGDTEVKRKYPEYFI